MSSRLKEISEKKGDILSKILKVDPKSLKVSKIPKLLRSSSSGPNTKVITNIQETIKNPLFNLSIADYELMCGNKMIIKMMPIVLECDEKQLKKFCKYINVFKENINSSPKSIKNKIKSKISLNKLPDDLLTKIVEKYKSLFKVKHVLRDWIPLNKLNWKYLSENPNAIDLLKANKHKIVWEILSSNPTAIELLKANRNKINWDLLSKNTNPKAIEMLKANREKINWDYLSSNPNAIELLKDNPKKINWEKLCENPSIFEKEFIDDNSYDSEDNEIVLDSFAKVQDIIHMPFNNETKNKNLVKSLFKKPIEYESGLNRLKEYFANTSEQHNIYVNYYHNILRQINAIKQHVNFPNLNNFDYKYYNKNKRFYKFDPKFNSDAKENTERQKDAQYIENEVIREFKTIIIYSENNRNSDDIIRNLEINKPKYIALQFIASLIRFNNTNVTQINILNKTIMILDILIAKRIALNDDNSMSVSKSISWSGTPKSNADDFQSKANIEKYKVTKAALIKEITENNLNDSDPFSGEEWADMSLNKLKKVISITSVINGTTYRHAFYVRTLYQYWRVSEKSLNNKVKFLNPYNRVPFTEDDKTAIMDAMITMYPRLERPRQGKGRQDISYNFYTGTINLPYGMFYNYATFNFSYILKVTVGEDILIPLATHIQIRLDFDEELDNAYIPNVLFENIKYLMENKKMFGKNMPIKMLDVLQEYNDKNINTMREYKDFFDKIKNAL